MKYITLIILVLFSINCFAGFMSKSAMFDCESARTFYVKKKVCNKNFADCVQIPKGFKCDYFSELDTEVDDLTKPKATKNQIVACDGEDDCKTKLLAKVCIDENETKYIDKPFTETYCSKPNGYYKKTVKQIRIDPIKKTNYDDVQNQIASQNKVKLDALKLIKAKLENDINEVLSNAELNRVILYNLKNLK